MPRSPVLSGPGFGIVAPEGAVDPGDDAHIAPTRFEEWLAASQLGQARPK
jgi:hypothetical protein